MTLKSAIFSVRSEGKGFSVCRKEKALETPLHFPLVVPTHDLANAIVQEFSAQGERADTRKMPLTQMALTAIDITMQNRADIIAALMRYAETDLLCQRAASPADLVAEQKKVWQPYLDWCRQELGVELRVGQGITPVPQNKSALSALLKHIEGQDAFVLTGLSEASKTLGSLVLGFALMAGCASVDEAFEAAELDSLWQSRKWGEDPVSQSRYAEIKRDLNVCARWFALCLMPNPNSDG